MAITDRMIRAAMGDVSLYEEVEHDPNATTEALVVVVVTALASGVGFGLGQVFAGKPGAAIGGVIGGVIGALVGWAVFAGICYLIGTMLFKADATFEEVLRTLGYSQTPKIAGIVSFIPILGWLIAFAAGIWALYLAFVALRAALDIDTGQTIATILLAIIPSVIVIGIIMIPFGLANLR